MPNWSEVLYEIQNELREQKNPAALDTVRRKYLAQVATKTGRNIIAYYSGWLQKPNHPDNAVNDKDKLAFMVNVHRMDRTKGLDLVLHTPGGDLAEEWLSRNMCQKNAKLVQSILDEFSDHGRNKSHARHISKEKCKSLGLSIVDMEADNDLQDLILTVHHAFMHTLASSPTVKIVENQMGVAYIEAARTKEG